MWWTGRIPGMSEEEDNAYSQEERRVEGLGNELLQEIFELLGENVPQNMYIPCVDFAKVPLEA